MFRVTIATADIALADRLVAALSGSAAIMRVNPDTVTLRDVGARTRPDLVVLDADAGDGFGATLPEAVAALRESDPACHPVAIGDEGDAPTVLRAVRAGASDFIGRDSGPEALRAQVARHLAAAPRGDRRDTGRLSVVLNGQPDGGEALFAINLAVLRAKDSGDALLVDCALPASEAGAALDIDLRYTVRDAIQDVSRLDRTLLSSALGRHRASGLYVLPLALSGEEIQDIDPDSIHSLLLVVRELFRETILNVGGIRHTGLVGNFVKSASRSYLVAPQKFTTVKASRELLTQIDPTPEARRRITLVVDDYHGAIALSDEQMREALGLEASVRLPPARPELFNALNTGQPLVLEQPRAPYSKAVARLAAADARPGSTVDGAPGRGMFGRLRPRAS